MSKLTDGGTLEVLTMNLDGHLFALEASYVREILDLVPVTEVPGVRLFRNRADQRAR